jgi:hypothetical protein
MSNVIAVSIKCTKMPSSGGRLCTYLALFVKLVHFLADA